MARERTYTDEQLRSAIGASTSWRGALRALGLSATSAGAMRSVRSNADRLQIDYGHFTGQRRWTEGDLRAAAAGACNWIDVMEALGLEGPRALAQVKVHSVRLGIDAAHLTEPIATTRASGPEPGTQHVARAGSLLAAAWFVLCGYEVSWPLEPSRYDLLVCGGAAIHRVQVKTTTARAGDTWKVYLSTARSERRTYAPDEIDDFFVIDGDLNYYLIPISIVGGLHAIHLSAYQQYRLKQAR
ncbi:group I intron-associated PD-(D/E)XK endonuclease [Agrococcus sp. DT81.2]|uniref:group I intron-associated PD-(D/E)XK endonuclease n=1 Tax=Agrococcus sp. DT81.2 TaxID=3393414 RepID=UPI003CE46CEC